MIIGATAGVGQALVGRLAQAGYDLILVGRDPDDLDRTAVDARARFGVETQVVVADAADPAAFAARVAEALQDTVVDVALIPMGVSIESDVVDGDVDDAISLVNVNLSSVVASTMEIARAMRSRRSGTIVGFSSIAASRGRPRNPAYAAAKRGLNSWFESLRVDLFESGVTVSWWTLGYVDTNLSFGQELPFPAANASDVAEIVVRRLDRAGHHVYPSWWRGLLGVLRVVPFTVFRRLKA